MRWFRFYSEFVDDPKIAMMSDSDQLLWVKALCLASESKQRGFICLTDDEICWKLRITLETWRHAIDKFRAKGMIEHSENGYQILNWSKRQFESDSSAKRVAKHREKKTKERKKQGCNVTSNNLVTPPDTDTDTDTNKISPLVPQVKNERERDACAPMDEIRPQERVSDVARFEAKFTQQAIAPWRRSRSRNDYDRDFGEFVRAWLSKQTCNQGREIYYGDACAWIAKRERDESGLDEIAARWTAYQEQKESTPHQESDRDRQLRWEELRGKLQPFVDRGWLKEVSVFNGDELRAITNVGRVVRERHLSTLIQDWSRDLELDPVPF